MNYKSVLSLFHIFTEYHGTLFKVFPMCFYAVKDLALVSITTCSWYGHLDHNIFDIGIFRNFNFNSKGNWLTSLQDRLIIAQCRFDFKAFNTGLRLRNALPDILQVIQWQARTFINSEFVLWLQL